MLLTSACHERLPTLQVHQQPMHRCTLRNREIILLLPRKLVSARMSNQDDLSRTRALPPHAINVVTAISTSACLPAFFLVSVHKTLHSYKGLRCEITISSYKMQTLSCDLKFRMRRDMACQTKLFSQSIIHASLQVMHELNRQDEDFFSFLLSLHECLIDRIHTVWRLSRSFVA